MTDDYTLITEVVAEGIYDFVIQELEQLGASIDQIDLASKVPEYRCIFGTDDTGPVNGDRTRRKGKIQYGIAVENPRMIEIDVLGTVGTRSRGDHDMICRIPLLTVNLDRVCIDKTTMPFQHRDGIAIVEFATHILLPRNH